MVGRSVQCEQKIRKHLRLLGELGGLPRPEQVKLLLHDLLGLRGLQGQVDADGVDLGTGAGVLTSGANLSAPTTHMCKHPRRLYRTNGLLSRIKYRNRGILCGPRVVPVL